MHLQGAGFSSLPSMERERSDSSNSLSSSNSASTKGLSEAERLAAAKNTKELVAKGINLFNSRGALKGVEFLMSHGLMESSPSAVSQQGYPDVHVYCACLLLTGGFSFEGRHEPLSEEVYDGFGGIFSAL